MTPQRTVLVTSIVAAVMCATAAWLSNYNPALMSRWHLEVPAITTPSMILFVADAVALMATSLRRRWIGVVLAVAVWVGCVAVLLGYAIESVGAGPAFRVRLPQPISPSPHAAVAAAFTALAIALVSFRSRSLVRIGHVLAAVAIAMGAFVFVAHLFGAHTLYYLSADVGMSRTTAIVIVLLSVGALSVTPRFSFVRVFYTASEGGRLARRFLPYVIGSPLLLAGAVDFGLRYRFFPPAAGMALLVVCVMCVLGAITWRYALAVNSAHATLERVVEGRTRRLTETIAELEDFSQALAHDVRGPLINLRQFLRLIEQEHAQELSSDGREYLVRAIRASNRVDRLTVAILHYGELSRRAFKFGIVKLDPLVAAVVDEVRGSYPNAEIAIRSPLGRAWADEGALREVVRELLDNACRFVRAGEAPRVEVSADAGALSIRLLVRDEGVGIRSDFHDRIFRPFEQLARAHEHSGIGLALVKRALVKMGGRVGVVSDGNHGSTFWIEIPQPPTRGAAVGP